MKNIAKVLLFAVLLSPLAAMPAKAHHDRDRDRDRDRISYHINNHYHYKGPWHRQGRWVHGRHGGRIGWWWVVGDSWVYYPVYPAPAVYPAPVRVYHPAPVPVVYHPTPFFGFSFNFR